MGKDWLYWGSRKSTKSRQRFAEENDVVVPPSGCMCAVLQLFDLNHYQFPLHQEEQPIVLKGVEAPRNSLELVECPSMEDALSSSTIKTDADLNIPVRIRIDTRRDTKSSRELTSECSSSPSTKTPSLVARRIQVKTRCDTKSPRESTSECNDSPSTKTPSLVARLMGLDLLPEGGSPSPSSSIHSASNSLVKSRLHNRAQTRHEDRAKHLVEIKSRNADKNSISGTRSLPETPRVSSSSSARRSDVEQRLSLQINKENNGEEFDLSAYVAKKVARRREARTTQEDENKSPGQIARQIVKQAKESVSKKVGLTDITNTIKNRDLQTKKEHGIDVVLLKPGKPSSFSTKYSSSLPSSDKIPLQHRPNIELPPKQIRNQEKSLYKCEKVSGCERRLRKPLEGSNGIRNKREDPFVRSPSKCRVNNLTEKMCKKIPLSNELLQVKKETSTSGTKLIHKKQDKQPQVYDDDGLSSKRSTQLSSCSSQSYNQAATNILVVPENKCNGHKTTNSGNEPVVEYQYYIQRILKRTGIDNKSTSSVSLAKWYTPNHPLDPSIFHHIELFHHTFSTIFTSKTSKLNLRCNRKLMFQLVDELLAEILRPYINFKPWLSSTTTRFGQRCQLYGSELIDILCSRIQAFPSANCQVLEDIDALIERDLRESHLKMSNGIEEESEIMVIEIERDIVESLVHELAMEVFAKK